MKHKNSKIIYVHRTVAFTHEANKELDEWFGQATRSIGSYFKSRSNRTPGTGLLSSEEKLLMPNIISILPEEREFRKEMEKFYCEIDIKIPQDGLELETGLEKDNDEPVSGDNMPLNIDDYIKYRFITSHPQVAKNKLEADGNQLIKFYIENPQDNEDTARKANDEKDEALLIYLAAKEDLTKVDKLLTNMGVDTRQVKDIVLELKKKAENESAYLIKVNSDKELDTRYKINKMIHSGVFEKVGTRILIKESGKEIGRDMKEAILYFNDPEYSQEVATLIARHKEFAAKKKITQDEE